MDAELKGFDPQATYSAAAAEYELASQRYWQFLSVRSVERLELLAGSSVLDLACGTGPATIAAARAVGPSGRVVASDYADGMIDIVRNKVQREQLHHVEVVQGDMTQLPYGSEFDAVICVLGIFFLEDMAAAARALWSYVKPGGSLIVTTLGPRVFTPPIDAFVEQARHLDPQLEIVLPWRRTEDPVRLASVLERGGVPNTVLESEIHELPMPVDDWWAIVMGSGLRRVAVDLGETSEQLRAHNAQWIRDHGIASIVVDANYSVSRKSNDTSKSETT